MDLAVVVNGFDVDVNGHKLVQNLKTTREWKERLKDLYLLENFKNNF